MAYVGKSLNLTCSTSDSTDIRWNISDGSSYTGKSINHTFQNSGHYSVRVSVYNGNVLESEYSKEIYVLFKDKIYSADKFHAIRSIYANDKSIILEGYFQKSENTTQSAFLIIDETLNIIDTLYSYQDVLSRISDVVQIGNSVYALNDETGNTTGYPFKTAESTGSSYEPVTQVFNYASGLIHYYSESTSQFYVDYYDYNLNLLWEKEISTTNCSDNSCLFNINNSLFFISFDKTSDKLYVNKFKNVSISIEEKEYSLGISAADRQVLFILNKPFNNLISIAVYSKSENKTLIYTIDEDCNFNKTSEVQGLFNQIPVISLENNTVITSYGNTISRYNQLWEKTNSKSLETSNYGLCKIGDNLFMLFQNLPGGLKLSYINSNLEDVTFE